MEMEKKGYWIVKDDNSPEIKSIARMEMGEKYYRVTKGKNSNRIYIVYPPDVIPDSLKSEEDITDEDIAIAAIVRALRKIGGLQLSRFDDGIAITKDNIEDQDASIDELALSYHECEWIMNSLGYAINAMKFEINSRANASNKKQHNNKNVKKETSLNDRLDDLIQKQVNKNTSKTNKEESAQDKHDHVIEELGGAVIGMYAWVTQDELEAGMENGFSVTAFGMNAVKTMF